MPCNIVVEPTYSMIKVIDLGLSRVASADPLTSYVTQRWYRAPEVVMNVVHDVMIDMWSAGAVLAELLRNEPLFRLESSHAVNVRDVMTCGIIRWRVFSL